MDGMEPSHETVPLLTPSDTAARLGVSVWTVYQLADDGYLTDVRVGPRLRRCRADEVEAMTRGESGIPRGDPTR